MNGTGKTYKLHASDELVFIAELAMTMVVPCHAWLETPL